MVKGSHISEEHKLAISRACKGRKLSEEHVRKSAAARRGAKRTPEMRKRISDALMGTKHGVPFGFKKGSIPWNKGKPYPMSDETKRKISTSLKGEKHWNWKGGITPENMRIRQSQEYILWRVAVFTRDNYQCVLCGDDRGGNLEADHIKPFAYFPELRFAIDNGRTLCRPCHQTQPTNGRQKHSSNYNV